MHACFFARAVKQVAPSFVRQILFYCAMMAIQNFGFFIMYFFLNLSVPVLADCANMRYWTGFFGLDCFVESFCVLWMAMGGYIDSNCCLLYTSPSPRD